MMKIRSWNVLLALIFVTFSCVAMAALEGENQTQKQKVTVKTISPINTTNNGDATSSFEGISSDAAAAGLADTVLIGAVSSEALDGNKKRVQITWHTMEKQKLGQPYREKLENPLTSSVIVDADEIPPQTNMIATGDLNLLVNSFNTLLDKETKGQAAANGEEEPQEQTSSGGSLNSGSDRFDTGSAGESALPESDMTGEVVPENVTEIAECNYRIDIDGLTIYRQARTDTMSGENGSLISKGTCEDTGETIPLVKQYGGECEPQFDEANEQKFLGFKVVGTIDGFVQTVQECSIDKENPVAVDAVAKTVACSARIDIPNLRMYKQARTDLESGISGKLLEQGTCADVGEPIFLSKDVGGECSVVPDIENRLAYRGYRITALVDGQKQIVQDCQTDFDDTLEIKSTFSGCGVTNDFVNGVSVQQEKLFYLDNDGQHEVRGCADSETKYPQFITSASCEPIVDLPNGIVYPQSRTAYKNNLGETVAISDCAIPENVGGIAVQDEVCTPEYEHDFANGQSYVRKRQYYSMNGEKTYLTSCGKSTESYPHLTFTDDCGVTYDDDNLTTIILGKKAIETPDGMVEISPCEKTDTTSYVYNGYTFKKYEVFMSPSEVMAVVVRDGFSETTSLEWRWKDGVQFIPDRQLTYPQESAVLQKYGCTLKNAEWRTCTIPRIRKVAWKSYIRLDGSVFSKWGMDVQDTSTAQLQ